MEGYQKKLTSVSVMWQANPDIRFQIKKTAGLSSLATITEGNKEESRANLGKLFRLLTSKSTPTVVEALKGKGLTVSALANDAPSSPKGHQGVVKVFPDFAFSECSALSCSHNIGLIVTVVDFELKKTVWQGNFKVGALMGGEVTDNLLDSFSSSLIDELQKAQLI